MLLKTFYCTIYMEFEVYVTSEKLKIWLYACKLLVEFRYPGAATAHNWKQMCLLEKQSDNKILKSALGTMVKAAEKISRLTESEN